MALTKVTKHVVHGSLLVQFKYADLSDKGVTGSETTFQTVGSAISITPLYADSILETAFSGSLQDNLSQGSNNQLEMAFYVNGQNEYQQTEMMGAAGSGNSHQQHGGDHDRIQHGIVHGHFHDFKQSVGMQHAYQPNSTNAQSIEVRIRRDGGSNDFTMREGFLIAKEISIGLATSGSQ